MINMNKSKNHKIKLGYGISLPIKYDKDIPDYSVENIKLIKKLSKQFECVQIMFSKTKLFESELDEIKLIIKNYKYIYVHANYQINIGAELLPSQTDLYNTGIEMLINEIIWAAKIGARGIVLHMGKNVKKAHDDSHIHNNMVKFVVELFKRIKNTNGVKNINKIKILLETPAGQGGEMCWDINEFVKFITKFEQLNFYSNLGICLDTCHMFQAGIDLNNPKIIKQTHEILFPVKHKIHLIHLNDSYHVMGSRIDRHEQLGKGQIQIDKLIEFIYEYKSVPMILETIPPYEEQIELVRK